MYQSLKIAALNFIYTDNSVLQAREKLQQTIIESEEGSGKRQLLVDVSVIIKADARTGIQRVVRAIFKQLLDNPPEGHEVKPVFASAEHDYHYVPESFFLNPDRENIVTVSSKPVLAAKGDIFLGLDLAAHVLPKHQDQLERWKRNGVKIHILVYDLLPVLHPEWFHSKTTRNFYRWLRSIAIVADSAICISKTVKADLAEWFMSKYSFAHDALPINVIPMGGDIEVSLPSKGLPENASQLLAQFKARKTALMVGTLEPRKGHAQVLDAFEYIWEKGDDSNLVILGKPGWKTEGLQARLLQHPKFGKNLFWLDNASDEFLEKLYEASYGLILASEGEGFGLPLVEAMQYGKPVLARDLPVFRELTGAGISFFHHLIGDVASQKSVSLEQWLAIHLKPMANQRYETCTWLDSAGLLRKYILN